MVLNFTAIQWEIILGIFNTPLKLGMSDNRLGSNERGDEERGKEPNSDEFKLVSQKEIPSRSFKLNCMVQAELGAYLIRKWFEIALLRHGTEGWKNPK